MGTLTSHQDKPLSYFNADRTWDVLLSIGMRPFVELGFMPEMLASSHETVFHYRGNVTPSADYDAWATLIRKLVGHWVDRYGVAEVAQSFFEVWNEPNLRRPGEVIHPGRAMGGITRYLERRGVHPARPVAWVVRFPDDRS